jgi:catechol 2,3-dioxygenase-like lactoylglutathione lyase family enzyme
MELLRAATLTTPDLDAAVARYRQFLDYSVVEAGLVNADLAASWSAPASAGRRYSVLRPASGADVFLRFVEGEVPATYAPLRTYGWAAIEICVQDTLAVNARMESSPFKIIGPPKQLDGLPAIFPMQVRGPDDEIVYLTQIRENLPDYDLPRAASLIDKLFILVLACSDMEASAAWFRETLGIQHGRTMEIVYSMINQAFELPADNKHRLATGIHERDCFLEFDQYPAEATARACQPGVLPPGVAMTTLRHPAFDTIPGDWIVPPAPRPGAIYIGKRAGTLRAPDGTLVEVVEA